MTSIYFIKCVVRWSENSVRLKNPMGIGYQMGQILWDFISHCEIWHVCKLVTIFFLLLSLLRLSWYFTLPVPKRKWIYALEDKQFYVYKDFILISLNWELIRLLEDMQSNHQNLGCDMTKPTMWLCAHWRLRSAWASAQSDQSLHCLLKKAWVLSYPLCAQRRLWSDWADAQADLSLR